MIVRAIPSTRYDLKFLIFACWSTIGFSLPVGQPEVASYARVSKNGDDLTNATILNVNEGRSFRNNGISRSPIYAPQKMLKLRNGEAFDNPSTVGYSTLDREAVFKMDASSDPQRAQDRFHPPAIFEHAVAHANAGRLKSTTSGSSTGSTGSVGNAFPVPDYATLPRDAYSTNYNFGTDSKPIDDSSQPVSNGESEDSFSTIPDSYQQPETYDIDPSDDKPKFSGFPSISSYGDKYPEKPVEFPSHYDRPAFIDDAYPVHHHHHHDDHDDHEYPHELVYDHPPPDHHYHEPSTTTTEEPEMNDQRLSKRPYSYYYIGKKLWYLPLYFSIYFIIYIAALVLKSISRHKINFPASLAAVAGDGRHVNDSEGPSWFGLTKKVLDGIDAYNAIGKTTGTTKN